MKTSQQEVSFQISTCLISPRFCDKNVWGLQWKNFNIKLCWVTKSTGSRSLSIADKMVNAGDRELKDIHGERSQHKSTHTYLLFSTCRVIFFFKKNFYLHKPTQSLELPDEVLQIIVACVWSFGQIRNVSLHVYWSEHSGWWRKQLCEALWQDTDWDCNTYIAYIYFGQLEN